MIEKDKPKWREVDYCCPICGLTTYDLYMIKDEVWYSEAELSRYLHLVCLERKLGRSLKIEDFTDAPVNEGIRFGMTLGMRVR